MNESSAHVWKKIGCFYGLTMLFSGVFGAFVMHAGKMDAGNLLYVTGAMWSPALATFATKKIFRESVRDLPWKWGSARYAWLGYLIPIVYTLPVYLVVWLSGLGGFNMSILSKTAGEFGWTNFPPGLVLALFVLFTATLGMVGKLSRAQQFVVLQRLPTILHRVKSSVEHNAVRVQMRIKRARGVVGEQAARRAVCAIACCRPRGPC